MTLEKYLNLLALIIGFAGTIFLLHGVLKMTPDVIGEIGQTRYGYSTPTLENLIIQKADTIAGFVLIAIAFVIQFGKEMFNIDNITLSNSKLISIALLLIMSIAIIGLISLIDNGIRKSYKLKTGKYLTKNLILRKLENDGQLNLNKTKYVEEYSSALLDIKRGESETDYAFLIRLGDFLGMDLRTKVEPTNDGGK